MRKLGIELSLFTILFIGVINTGCLDKQPNQQMLVQEILSVERQFNNYANEYGVMEAFLEFAADSAVLIRGGQIIKGKDAIRSYFESQPYSNVQLSWKPDFVNVSDDGGMAYTYGSYSFSALDSLNDPIEAKGIFHTVWERQEGGGWKYVYD